MEAIVIFFLVIGGMFAGWFTPTQAGGIGAAGVLIVGLARKKVSLAGFTAALRTTVGITCFLLCILSGGLVFGRFIAVSNIPVVISQWAVGFSGGRWGILALIVVIHLIGGCFMDAFALIVLTIPIFFPVILALGFDPIWYGVIIVLMVEMAAITPPVGLNVFVIKGVAKDVPLETIFKGVYPFVGALLICVALLIIVPQIATFLPTFMQY